MEYNNDHYQLSPDHKIQVFNQYISIYVFSENIIFYVKYFMLTVVLVNCVINLTCINIIISVFVCLLILTRNLPIYLYGE